MEEQSKQKLILKLLLELAGQDDQISEAETQFIRQVKKVFAWSEDMDKLVLNSDEPIALPKTEQERMNVIYYLLFMLNADSQIDDREVRFIKKVGFKMGFRSRLIEDMLECITKDSTKKIAPEILLNKIRKYLN